jgi:antitoxin FitA
MGKMVQIRNMPDKLHRTLKARAAQAGMSLSEYLLRELKKVGDKPSVEELLERIRSRPPIEPGVSSGEIIREGREERMRHLDELADTIASRR